MFESAFDSSEEDNNQVNDRYKASEGYHAVPPPYTGNFVPPRPDLSFAGSDNYVFKSAVNESVTSVHKSEKVHLRLVRRVWKSLNMLGLMLLSLKIGS
ncbi:hypothetical protein Tco_1388237 [Tanacetum coccineum]